MTNILSEKDYQKFLLKRLEQDNGFVIRKASNYDRLFAVDREMLFQFLNATQSHRRRAALRTGNQSGVLRYLPCGDDD